MLIKGKTINFPLHYTKEFKILNIREKINSTINEPTPVDPPMMIPKLDKGVQGGTH